MVDTPGFVHGANVSGRKLDPGPLLYQSEDVAETFLTLVRQPRDEVAVGWPARAAQLAYAVAPRPTEYLTGAAFRWLLSRASPMPKSPGTIMEAEPHGTSVDGGWLARKKIPPAGEISKLLVLLGVAGLVMLKASPAVTNRKGKRRPRLVRKRAIEQGSRRLRGHR
jgi:hypothetical protein